MDMKTEIRAQLVDYHSHIELRIAQKNNGIYGVVQNVTFESIEPGMYSNPSLSIGLTAAQVLMDDLWHSGIRPTEGTGSAGSLKATENHLIDMRKIAFNRLKIEL